jgi:hypothetical protein
VLREVFCGADPGEPGFQGELPGLPSRPPGSSQRWRSVFIVVNGFIVVKVGPLDDEGRVAHLGRAT